MFVFVSHIFIFFFFFNDTATTEIYTLSLHDALPISAGTGAAAVRCGNEVARTPQPGEIRRSLMRSEEHTSELQSRLHLVCRLLLEKKKKKKTTNNIKRKKYYKVKHVNIR